MDFFTSVKTCFTKYTDFSGRASRSEYWWFVLFNMIVGSIASILSYKLYAIASLAVMLPILAAQVRRLHDVDISGYWILGFWLLYSIFLLGMFAGMTNKLTEITSIFVILILALVIIAFKFLITKSDPNANQYGDVPKS